MRNNMLEATRLMTVLAQKMTWHNAKANLHSRNIAHADTGGISRRVIRSFSEVVKNRPALKSQGSHMLTPLTLNSRDEIDTKQEIAKEWEIMDMAEASAEHEAILNLFRKYSIIHKTILGRS